MPVNNLVKQNNLTDLSIIKFAKRSFLLIGSSVTRLAVQLIIIFIFSRKLSLTEYGLYQSAWLYINVVSIIALFGLPSLILSSSVSSVSTWIKQNKKIFTILFLLLNFTPLLYILFAVTEYNLTTKLLVIALSIVQNISILTETTAIKNKKEKLVLISNFIFSLGYLLCHLIILYTNYSLQLILTGIIVMFILKTLFLCFFANPLTFDNIFKTDTSIGNQWFYLGIYDVLSVIFKWLDKWVILFYVSIAQFAVYFNGSYEIPVFGLMLSAVGNIMVVDLSEQNNDNAVKVKMLFKNSSLLLAAVVFPSFCFLFFFSSDFFTLVFSTKYIEAIPIFVISIFVLPLRITNFTAVLQTYRRSDLIVKGAVLDLLIAIVLMIILYPLLQLKSVALAFVLSTYLQAGYYLWHTGILINKKISYFFPFKKLFFMLLISVTITGIFYYLFSFLSFPLNIILGISLCTILISTFLFYNYKRSEKFEK